MKTFIYEELQLIKGLILLIIFKKEIDLIADLYGISKLDG